MVELAVLLLGFTAVFLGIVVVCGLADSDIRVFLSARNQAELMATAKDPKLLSGSEFGSWSNFKQEVYDDRSEIVFSPMDKPNRWAGNSIDNFQNAFSEGRYSVISEEKSNYYRNQAHLDNWMSLQQAQPQLFRADFVPGLEGKNALDAAELVRAGAASKVSGISTLCLTCASGNNFDSVAHAFYALFGVKISRDMLIDAPGNQVAFPVLNESL